MVWFLFYNLLKFGIFNADVPFCKRDHNLETEAKLNKARHAFSRVSKGLTVSRKTVKNLAVRRKNERILTVSCKKMLTVKKSNHKIRSRDLLLGLMCYAFITNYADTFDTFDL